MGNHASAEEQPSYIVAGHRQYTHFPVMGTKEGRAWEPTCIEKVDIILGHN